MRFVKQHQIHLTALAVVVFFLLAIGLTAVNLTDSQRQKATTDSATQANRHVEGTVTALNRSLLGVDVLLSSLAQGFATQQPARVNLNVAQVHKDMHTIVSRNLILRRLALLNDRAEVLASSEPAGTPLTLPGDFMARVLGSQVSNLLVSSPVLHNPSGEPSLLMARHINLPNGQRAVMLAEVLLAQFSQIMAQGADIDGLEVTLERGNGQLLAALPAQDKLLGTRLHNALTHSQQDARPGPARLSGQPALVSAQPILYDDVVVTASIRLDAALAQWRQERDFIAIIALLFVATVAAAGGFTTWYLARMAQARLVINRSKAEIEHLAFHDHLTRLPNRLLLMDRLDQALANCQRKGHHGVLLFLDLDHFKTLNDTQGHHMGDLLLKQVAQRLTRSVRAYDTVARLGGDEFVILLEELSEDAMESAEMAQRIGNTLIQSLNEPYVLADKSHKCSASVGATLFGKAPTTAAELLQQADIAMYQVKAHGRNNLSFFDPQMQADITARAQLEADLHEAVSQQQFVLFYQPQVSQDGSVLGAEVLIRWQHPSRGLVMPLEFIGVAEESDLINQIGLWVLTTACQQLTQWQQHPATERLALSVNVSARQFRQSNFVALVNEVINQTGVNPRGLKMELTESLVLDNVNDSITKMTVLKALGVRFSMDDFGTGQSSLSYLTRLPLDQLKIDQSFVRNIGIAPSDGMIVQTIIGMASNLGLQVIAEGVETPSQKAFLSQHGCTLNQGYLFGRPVGLADFETFLTQAQTTA